MKKSIKWIFILLLLSIMPFFADASWIVNENEIIVDDTPIKKAVCMSPDGDGMYYSSIEEGLNKLNQRAKDKKSAQLLYVLPGQNLTLNKDVTIGENVTMIIPFDAKDSKKNSFDETCYKRSNNSVKTYRDSKTNEKVEATNSKTGPIDCNIAQIKEYRKTKLTLSDNVTLNIEHHYTSGFADGRLIVGGEYGETGVNGYYSEVLLNKGASIYNGGTLECYGYIKERYYPYIKKEEDTRRIDNFHSRLVCPMAIYDFPYSGSDIKAIYDNNICLINTFDFPSLQTKVHLDSYVDFAPSVYVNRSVASTTIKFNNNVSIINSDVSQDGLFRYDAELDSRNTFQLDLDYRKDISDECTYRSAKESVYTEYDIYGKVNIGYLRIELSKEYVINTSNYFLPLSHRMHITLKKGSTFGVGYKIKCMPGNILRIEQGATMNLVNSLVVYDKNVTQFMDKQRPQGTFFDAKFYVNGSIYVAESGTIGGRILTEDKSGNAKINLKDVKNNENLYTTSYEGKYKKPVTYEATGIVCKPKGTDAQKGIEMAVCIFEIGKDIISGAWVKDESGVYQAGWKWNQVLIPFRYDIEVTESPEFENSVYGYDVVKQIATIGGSRAKSIVLNCVNKKYVAYSTYKEHIKINVNRKATGKSLTPNFSFMNFEYVNLKKDVKIQIKPAKAYLLSVTEDEVANPSGRGTVVTTVQESIDYDGTVNSTWYTIVVSSGSFGVSNNVPIKYPIPENGFIRIKTEYHKRVYNRETIQVNKGTTLGPVEDYKGKNNWATVVTGDITLHRYGGKSNIIG